MIQNAERTRLDVDPNFTIKLSQGNGLEGDKEKFEKEVFNHHYNNTGKLLSQEDFFNVNLNALVANMQKSLEKGAVEEIKPAEFAKLLATYSGRLDRKMLLYTKILLEKELKSVTENFDPSSVDAVNNREELDKLDVIRDYMDLTDLEIKKIEQDIGIDNLLKMKKDEFNKKYNSNTENTRNIFHGSLFNTFNSLKNTARDVFGNICAKGLNPFKVATDLIYLDNKSTGDNTTTHKIRKEMDRSAKAGDSAHTAYDAKKALAKAV